MKTIIIFLLGFILYSCGSDNPVTTSNNPAASDTVTLFAKDSIYVKSGLRRSDSVEYFCPIRVDVIRCSFNLSASNIISQNIRFNSNGYLIDTNLTLPNTASFDLSLPVNSNNFNSKLITSVIADSTLPYHASLRNIRLWYVN